MLIESPLRLKTAAIRSAESRRQPEPVAVLTATMDTYISDCKNTPLHPVTASNSRAVYVLTK